MSRASVKRDLEYMRSRFTPQSTTTVSEWLLLRHAALGPRYECQGSGQRCRAYALLSMQALLSELQPGCGTASQTAAGTSLRDSGCESNCENHRLAHPNLKPERRQSEPGTVTPSRRALLKRLAYGSVTTNRKEDRPLSVRFRPQRLVH